MASNTNEVFGFELLNKLHDNDLLKKEDVIVLFVHWYLVKCGLRCIGIGDSKSFDASEKGSELLPEDWSKGQIYSLRYIHNGKLYILHGIKSDANLLLNLLRTEDHNVSNVQFPIDQTVNQLHGSLESLIPNYQTVLHAIRKELIEQTLPGFNVEVSTQTTRESPQERRPRDLDNDPLRVPYQPPSRNQPWVPEVDPRSVGRSDLDPFGRGGGMIFDPFGNRGPNPLGPRGSGGLGVPGRLPPGAAPPGARFDPFGPPDNDPMRPRRNRNPDNDHLPPPGYDDMFM